MSPILPKVTLDGTQQSNKITNAKTRGIKYKNPYGINIMKTTI